MGAASEDDKIKEQLMLLEDAIKEKCIVQFSYTNSHDEIKEIQAEPVCLPQEIKERILKTCKEIQMEYGE